MEIETVHFGRPLVRRGRDQTAQYTLRMLSKTRIMTLRTEKKAQERAYVYLKEKRMATEEELDDLKELFHLYNIQYINDIILACLELLYTILQIAIEINKEKSK